MTKSFSSEIAWRKLIEIQKEYFALIKSNPIIKDSKCSYFGDGFGSMHIPLKYSNEKLALKVSTKKGIQPVTIHHLEVLFDDVTSFWIATEEKLLSILTSLKGKLIHIEDHPADSSLRRYGPFYKCLLISDQTLMFASEYDEMGRLENWQTFAQSVLDAIFRQIANEKLFIPDNDLKPFAAIVPTQQALDKQCKKKRFETTKLAILDFVSEMLNRKFESADEFIAYSNAFGVSLEKNPYDPKYVNILTSAYNVKSFPEYIKKVISNIHIERGIELEWILSRGIGMVLVTNLTMRFSEYERFAADAYFWEQEAEIPTSSDLPLYEWWFKNSAKKCNKILGSRYSQDFIAKITPLTPSFEFLKEVNYNDLIEFLRTDPIIKLHEDLEISKIDIKNNRIDLSKSINIINDHMTDVFRNFQNELKKIKSELKPIQKINLFKIMTSGILTVASFLVPPLSVVSLLWGGSIHDIHESNKKNLNNIQEIKKRPIATLVKWKTSGKIES